MKDNGTDRPEGISVLAPQEHLGDVRASVTRRRALSLGLGSVASMYLAACGGKSGAAAGTAASTTSGLSPSSAIEANLLMANWADYTDPKDYKRFTAKFGPKIKAEGYGSNDELIAKLAGGAAYDICVPSGGPIAQIVQKGLARPLDHALLPNLTNLQPKFRQTKGDPGNKYSVCKDYGITSFYYRKDVVKDPPTTLKAWWEILPKYKGKSINVIEGSGELLPLAMAALGLDINTVKDADYETAMKLVMPAKPAISTINSTYIERLGRGQIDIGIGWNGDVLRAKNEAAKHGIDIEFFVPTDAGIFWTDNWLIPAASKNPVAAHKWINWMLEPAVAGNEWSYMGYTVPVIGVDQHVDKKMAASPIVAIPDAVLAKYQSTVDTPQTVALRAKYYTQFKA
jgi:spermidine/putrescine-binding protein